MAKSLVFESIAQHLHVGLFCTCQIRSTHGVGSAGFNMSSPIVVPEHSILFQSTVLRALC